MRNALPLLALGSLLLGGSPALAQYVFLDANGDGVNDASDQLDPTGPTDLDVWFVTDENRDGSPAVCRTDPTEPLSINSYEIVLEAFRGRVEFGPMENRLPFSDGPSCFASYADTTSTTLYHNGWGWRDIFPPGRYRVATLRVRVLEGDPALRFLGRSPSEPTDLTSFGTGCTGADFDNTYVLGEEFFTALGIGSPFADAGGPYHGAVGTAITLDGGRSRDPDGDPLDYAWTFDDGGSASGRTVTHAWEAIGLHRATLEVSSPSGSDTDAADVNVVEAFLPVANAGGPYTGRPGYPVPFNGSASFDPDGDPLSYLWLFGDDGHGSGMYPHHIYAEVGVYEVTLRVTDGTNFDSDATTATIAQPKNDPPIADAGGPYEGIAGRWIQLGATGSSDPDGDDLTFQWSFGDGDRGTGIVVGHAYRAAGDYTVTLAVADGIAITMATTAATIRAAFAARAFVEGGPTIPLDASDDDVAVRIEPVDGEFRAIDLDPDGVRLLVQGATGPVEIPATMPVLLHDDSDGNGIAEFVALFARERLREVAAAGGLGAGSPVQVTGLLYRGGSFVGDLDAAFVSGTGFSLRVTPNPFNPQARLTLLLRKGGGVSAALYDVRGRRVRSVLRDKPLDAGRHVLTFDARDDNGMALASGVYFLQVRAPDGALTGRVVVAK